MRQHGGLDLTRAVEASHHIAGASREMAEVFVAALERSAARPSTPIEGRGPAPAVTPRSSSASCTMALAAARAAQAGGQVVDEGAQRGREALDWGGRRLRETRDWLERQRRRLP
jgi:hypothetical protein